MLARGVVRIRRDEVVGRTGAERIGHVRDATLGVVVDEQLLAVGVRQRGEQAVRVAERDAVAVRVGHVVEHAVGAELPDGLVGLGQPICVAAESVSWPEIAGRRLVAAVGLEREEAIDAARPAQDDIAVGLDLGPDVPVVGPAPAERAELVARDDRLAIDAAEGRATIPESAPRRRPSRPGIARD